MVFFTVFVIFLWVLLTLTVDVTQFKGGY